MLSVASNEPLIWAILIAVVFGIGLFHILTITPLDEKLLPTKGPGLWPVDFPEANVQIAKDQPEYRTLPAFIDPHNPYGERVTCWGFTWRERILLLFRGRLWCSVLTFKQPLQPLYFSVDKSDVLSKVK